MEILIVAMLILVFVLSAVLGVVSLKYNSNVSGIISAGENVTFTDITGVQANPSVPKAQPATLTVRTNNTSGSLTMTNSSHGIVTGQRVDLYWTGGQCYGAIVGTVAGTVVPIASVSGGSVLPSAATAITVGIATSAPFNLTGNNLTALVLSTPTSGYFVFNNGTIDVFAAYVTAGFLYTWKTGDVAANPLAGAVPTIIYMSHTLTTASVTTMQAATVNH